MTCDCIDKIRERLKEHHKGEVSLDLRCMINLKSNDVRMALPPLYYRYKVGKKTCKSHVAFTYCPFCGKKP